MKQVVMFVVAGLMAFVLSGCGEDRSKEPAVHNETTVVEPQKADEMSKPADEMNKPADTAAPAEGE